MAIIHASRPFVEEPPEPVYIDPCEWCEWNACLPAEELVKACSVCGVK